MERATHAGRWIALAIAGSLLVAGCARTAAEEPADIVAAKVEAIKGTALSSVTLSEDAAKRLDVRTEAVRGADAGAGRQIPYAAVFYDPKGATWVFVNTKGRTFMREPITVDRIEGEVAFLTQGPAAGTDVVTVGGAEIYGAEIGVGEDE